MTNHLDSINIESTYLGVELVPWGKSYNPKFKYKVNGYESDYYQSQQFLSDVISKQSARFNLHAGGSSNIHVNPRKGFLLLESDNGEVVYQNTYNTPEYFADKSLGRILQACKLLKVTTTKEDDLFVLRTFVEEAEYFLNYTQDEFIVEFGYDSDLKSVRRGEDIYKSCEQTYRGLGFSESILTEILEELSERGIE